MSKVRYLCCLLIATYSYISSVQAQSVLYATATGETSFHSETPLENILAVNKKTQVILNTSKNEIAARMYMRDFVFPNKLMQEHFNENYMESAKYPTASFTGTLDGTPDYSKDGEFPISATGTFSVHGVSQKRTLKGKMKIADGKIYITCDFEVALTDHKIEVPSVVFVKIAQVIQVKTSYTLTPYNK